MNLSESISVEEFDHSTTAEKKGIINKMPMCFYNSAIELCTKVIEPLIRLIGEKPIILSGYRSPALNIEVGGVSTSQHLKGEAIDITFGVNNNLAWKLLTENLDYDQAIAYKKKGFIHISCKKNGNRNQTIIKKN